MGGSTKGGAPGREAGKPRKAHLVGGEMRERRLQKRAHTRQRLRWPR